MDILIKSFTRPYYLDKCIKSIKKNIKGLYNIIILDDGTPERFLDEILRLHPDVIIRKSPFYNEKIRSIENHLEHNTALPQLYIPSKFWQDNASAASDYFLLLEDDMWIIGEIDIDDVKQQMRAQNISTIKTALFGVNFYEKYDSGILGKQLIEIKPQLSGFSPFLFQKIYVNNTLKSYSILLRLGLADIKKFLPIYAIYMVAGAFYDKKFYEYIWNSYEGKVNENHQLSRVLQWNRNFPEKKYARLQHESLTTSFTSSATNDFKGINLNPFVYNRILSEAWMNGEFPVDDNNKGDFDENIIIQTLKDAKHPLASVSEWKKWTERFRKQYQDVGYNV